MLTFPDHLPVLALSPAENYQQAELIGKLLGILEADGIVVSRIENLSSAKARGVITHLTRADLLLVSGAPTLRSSILLSSPTRSSGSQTTNSSFMCQSRMDLHSCAAAIKRWLDHCESTVPQAGAVLIGGKSSRMGRPKHLIHHPSGETWLERSLTTLRPFVDELFISGAGEIPPVLRDTPRVDDLPGVQGPLAGIGALIRKRPFSSWLVLACDLPKLQAPAIAWLLNQRTGRYRAIIAKNPSTGRSEPLLAWYDYRSGPLIENLIASGGSRARELVDNELTSQPWIPDDLAASWQNVNYPEELGSRGPSGP
ncbi:MAG: molybdenum cofactor guanylyltransferase [Desulfofustis sp.]|nr:molybdenum cofactor guanylyltransferase [Desulfofustis sp.]